MMWFLFVYALHGDGHFSLLKVQQMKSHEACLEAGAYVELRVPTTKTNCMHYSQDDMPKLAPPPKGYKREE